MHAGGPVDWEDLRWLLVIVRAGSAAAAAPLLGANASTVTRRVAALEARFGATLFVRTRDGLRPTDTARHLAAVAERVDAEVRRADRLIAKTDAVSGTVRLATTEGLATLLVDRGLLRVCERHPELSLELLAGNTVVDLTSGDADVALRLMRPREGEVRIRKLAELPLAVCASEAWIARHGAPTDVAGLASADRIEPSGELAQLPEARWLATLPGRAVLRTSSYPALVAAVRAGAGFGVLPDAWAHFDGVVVLFPAPIPPRTLWLAFAPDAAQRPAVRVVADTLAALVGAVVEPNAGGWADG